MSNRYLELKLSWELFHKSPEMLTAGEISQLEKISLRQTAIEQKILSSTESVQVVVPDETLAIRIEEIRKRYPDSDEFAKDMTRIGLSEAGLQEAVRRDLRVEATLEKIASQVPVASTVDAEIYYRLHPEAFTPPASRRLRHILITFNNPGEKLKVMAQLEFLRSTLESDEKFGEAALRHSQCPTAMDGGKLGLVKRGQLFPALEEAAFSLQEGEISSIQESPIGLHILRCDEILSETSLHFAEVEARIIEKLTDQRRQEAQKKWIKSLFANK